MTMALNQYWYLDLQLDLPSTDIDWALILQIGTKWFKSGGAGS